MSPLSNLLWVLGYWCLVIVVHYALTGRLKYRKFRFSKRNYYLFVSAFAVPVLVEAYASESVGPLLQFVALGIAGVMGETLASIWWHLFFRKRFWEYEVQTVYHKYTSWLNFIPWAVGGMIYLDIVRLVHLPTSLGVVLWFFGVLVPAVVAQVFVLRYLLGGKKFDRASLSSSVFFFSPIILLVAFLMGQYGGSVVLAVILFGLVATLAEYLFGKATESLISKKMWKYVYWSVDKGHFTVLSIPLFVLGGLYFWVVGILLHLL